MTSAELKAQIDSQITNETLEDSVTQVEVGNNMKAIVDYATEQVTHKVSFYSISFFNDGSVNDNLIYSNLPGTAIVSFISVGVYEITADSSVFTSNKTVIPPFGYQGTTTNSGAIRLPIFNANVLVGYYWAQRITSTIVRLNFTDTAGVLVSPFTLLADREIQLEIKVYI